jgi:DNA polymerase I-like protein with 3'-5' exonuclease and polymerase domains
MIDLTQQTFYDSHLAFDLETDGTDLAFSLQPWRYAQGKAWITSLVWIRHRNGIAEVNGCLNPTRLDMAAMLQYAITHDLRIIGHNVVFDIAWLFAYGLEELVMRAKFLDSMLVWKALENEPEYESKPGKKKSYSLKAAVPILFPEHAGYESGIDFHDASPEARAKLHEYNKLDVIFTFRAAAKWWSQLTEKQRRCVLIEAECLPLVADTNLRGMLVDTITLSNLRADLEKKARMKLAKLNRFGVDETVVRSPAKLRKVLFEDWGLKPLKQTATGADSTDKESLHELAISTKDWRVRAIRTYRETLNAIGKFVDSPLEAAEYNGDGYARPQFKVYSTYTGRFSCSSTQKIYLNKKKIVSEETE